MRKNLSCVVLFALVMTTCAFAQKDAKDKSQRPSPPASASCDLGSGKTIKTDYSSPRMKGRKIYGGLVPYGAIWRTGANDATTLVTSADITVGGTAVPAGSYTIFTVPGADKWSLVISKGTGEWGTEYPGADKDLARVDMKVSPLSSSVENFTIAYDKTATGCTMRLDWESTSASVAISGK